MSIDLFGLFRSASSMASINDSRSPLKYWLWWMKSGAMNFSYASRTLPVPAILRNEAAISFGDIGGPPMDLKPERPGCSTPSRLRLGLRNDPSRFIGTVLFDEEDDRPRRGAFDFAPQARGPESLRHRLRFARIPGGVDAQDFPVVEALGAKVEGVIEPGVVPLGEAAGDAGRPGVVGEIALPHFAGARAAYYQHVVNTAAVVGQPPCPGDRPVLAPHCAQKDLIGDGIDFEGKGIGQCPGVAGQP